MDTPETSIADGPDDDLRLAERVRSVVVPLARALRQQTGGRLTATQASLLGTVLRHGPVTISELAAREQLSLPMVSKVVSALEADGLVARSSDPADGRTCPIVITAAGHRWVDTSREQRDRWLANRLADLDDAERHRLRDALAVLHRLVDEPT